MERAMWRFPSTSEYFPVSDVSESLEIDTSHRGTCSDLPLTPGHAHVGTYLEAGVDVDDCAPHHVAGKMSGDELHVTKDFMSVVQCAEGCSTDLVDYSADFANPPDHHLMKVQAFRKPLLLLLQLLSTDLFACREAPATDIHGIHRPAVHGTVF
ncbi:hypothetical protein EYF80_012273 [Liparis tanakae]|uniref:Uncharacterized protein n=1 Tax=Liparis tanakae TaxID=230148 RepID=A0A4Z2IHI0_9TELE|nr:hypothetical protein EYF80_012273 [Liparis tanakae]